MPATPPLLRRLRRDYLLQALLLLTVVLAIIDRHGLREYLRWLDLPTLAGLAGLLVLTGGVRSSGYGLSSRGLAVCVPDSRIPADQLS